MKKLLKALLLSTYICSLSFSLVSCTESDTIVLRILNSEDYIYLHDKKDPESLPDLVDQFKDYVKNDEELNAKFPKISVVYDTSDTNETIYSEIQTGKSNYDLINVSEYMAQKIVRGGFAVPLYRENGQSLTDPADYNKIANYENFASKTIRERLDQIAVGEIEGVDATLRDYAVGYMWGTLGILFNPQYDAYSDIDSQEIITDMMDYDSLWDSKYKGTISIKNSMRDTYALGIMHTYKDEFVAIMNKYLEDGDLQAYQNEFSKIFNRCDANSVEEVRESLEELKTNIFGLEVDSGKEDIITGKIGMNLAWSGDAVYSMDQGDDAGVELYFSIPEYGSNIWSDVWVMPNCGRSDLQYDLAHVFLDFLSDPYYASQNMEYTGYTSFVGGDAVLELIRDWYDIRTEEMFEEVILLDENEEEIGSETYTVYSVNHDEEDFAIVDYPDFIEYDSELPEGAYHDSTRDEESLVYFIPYEKEVLNEDEEKEIILIEEPLDYSDLIANSKLVMIEDEEGNKSPKTYGDLTIVNASDSELEEVDLSYFFNDTFYATVGEKYSQEELDEGVEPVLYRNNVDTLFYTDSYLPFTYEIDGEEKQNISVGRQFYTQYPSEETIQRCAVMSDYGENNELVMKMWENFKSDPLPTWAILLLVIFLIGIIALILYFAINKGIKKAIHNKRVKNLS